MTAKKLPYGSVNVEMFQQVKKKILTEPRSFDMADWGMLVSKSGRTYMGDVIALKDRPPCGTIACIAGWANALKHLKTHKTLRTCEFYDQFNAAEILGVRIDDMDRVFHLEQWPVRFQDLYHDAHTKQDRAEAAAEYIDWICGV